MRFGRQGGPRLLLIALPAALVVLLQLVPAAHAFLQQPPRRVIGAGRPWERNVHGSSTAVRTARPPRAASLAAATTSTAADVGSGKPKVVIAGGGFGGLYSALRLAELARPALHAEPAVDITLVDRSDRFVFLPLLYELAVGEAQKDEVAPLFRMLLASTGVRFVQGEITALDPHAQTVSLTALGTEGTEAGPAEKAQTLAYDRLVLALGSEPVVPPLPSMGGSSGSGKGSSNSMTFYRLEDAERLAQKLGEMEARSQRGSKGLFRVVIVGGGYSGVELAANLAARLGRDRGAITLVDRGFSILHNSPDHVRAAANKRLSEEGVEVLLGVDVMDATDATVVLRDRSQVDPQVIKQAQLLQDDDDGQVGGVAVGGSGGGGDGGETTVLPADLIVWTAGAGVSPLVKKGLQGLEQDGRGRVRTDKGLRAKGSAAGEAGAAAAAKGSVFVVGDNAAVEGHEDALPSTAQVAFQASEIVAWNLWSSLSPSAPGPLDFRYTALGEMLTLGPMDAAVSGLRGLFQLEGPPASLARRLVYVMRMPTGGQRLRAARSWVKGRAEKVKRQLRGALAAGGDWE